MLIRTTAQACYGVVHLEFLFSRSIGFDQSHTSPMISGAAAKVEPLHQWLVLCCVYAYYLKEVSWTRVHVQPFYPVKVCFALGCCLAQEIR
jgi:hypothetical protein